VPPVFCTAATIAKESKKMRYAMIGLMLCASGAAAANDEVQVVDEKNLSTLWVLDTKRSPPPKYPVQLLRARIGGCVAVATLIESDGRVTTRGSLLTQSNATSDRQREQLEKAAVDAAAALRYDPAPANAARKPTLTYFTVGYAMHDAGRPPDVDAVKARCAIADFAATVRAKLDRAPTR
jgi:hypothetical protein